MVKINPKDWVPSKRRTFGRTADCKGCRYWSEKMAKQEGMGPLQAFCLNRNSPFAYTYTRPDAFCGAWASGEYGAIDGEGEGAY